MGLLKKVYTAGKGSRVIVLPADWLRFYEAKAGHKLEYVEVEVDGALRIRPHMQEVTPA